VRIIQLNIKGFRSLKNINWNPGNLNILIGPNGSGKSNLLRFLELIAISAKGGLGKYIQTQGGMNPILWDGKVSEIYFKLSSFPFDKELESKNDINNFELTLQQLGISSTYKITREILTNTLKDESGSDFEKLRLIERDSHRKRIFNEDKIALADIDETISEEETLLSIASGPFSLNRTIPKFQKYLSSWAIYHDIHVYQGAPIRQTTIAKMETQVESNGQNLISVLHTLYSNYREFEREINNAMRAAYGNDFDKLVFPPAADQRIQLRVRWKSLSREQSVADLSDGTLRFLFLLAVLANPEPPPLIAIDEPAIGLHPSMLPIVADYAIDASTRTQIIFTTHSPEFLNVFKNAKLTPTVSAWENGETVLKILEEQNLKYWLKEYSLGSLFLSGELEDME
jgi:predicted ATPase